MVKSSRANRHDCLHIPQSTPIISLVWGGNRARSSRLSSWTNSNVSYCPTMSMSVQQTPDSAYPRTPPHVSQERDNKTLSLYWQHTEFELCMIKTWAFYPYFLIRPNSTAEWHQNSPIIMKKKQPKTPKSLLSACHQCLLFPPPLMPSAPGEKPKLIESRF